MQKLALLGLLAMLSGCSATTLRCGTAGEDSYVEVISVPQDIAATSRHFADLCGFAYEEEK